MLTLRCENGGSTENLDLSIELLEAAPASAVDQREAMDSTLVQALRHRLAATADSADLDRVIECCEVGVAAAPVDGEGAVKWLIGWETPYSTDSNASAPTPIWTRRQTPRGVRSMPILQDNIQ